MQSEELHAKGPSGENLRVEFLWRGDRFGHVISVVEADGTARPQWESVEGAAEDNWPTSPPLQSVRIEQLADGRRAALLVGSAGNSHWSASVEPVRGETILIFDVACRHQGTPIWLGSSYRECARGACSVEIRPASTEISRVSPGDVGRISIQPVEPPLSRPGSTSIRTTSVSPATTIRWKYQIRLRLTPDP